MAALTPEIVAAVIDQVRPKYTLTPPQALEITIRRVIDAIEKNIPGDLVECGTWMGGCSYAMLHVQRAIYGEIRRPVWMYDSFEGMSPPSKEDGNHAAGWYGEQTNLPRDVASNHYCIAPYPLVVAAVAEQGFQDHVILRKGWLADTLPERKPDQVAVLRIDCDWYEPVMCCLEQLVPNVSVDGSIILDDYYAWEGCTLATHEYLAKHNHPWIIRSIEDGHGCWMIKRPATW